MFDEAKFHKGFTDEVAKIASECEGKKDEEKKEEKKPPMIPAKEEKKEE